MGEYKYYSTQRPIDPGTLPKFTDNPIVKTVFYVGAGRKPVENGTVLAWGEVIYNEPLTDQQISDYELCPSRDNPDLKERMNVQAQAVGAWEERNHVPEGKRLTWWYSDFGSYVPSDFVTPEQLANRFKFTLQHPTLRSPPGKQRKPPHRESR